MIKTSYSKNYLKIYLWAGLSLILNFLSMVIVVPYLTKNQDIYGIYTICISISIFLSYADLGFLSAGMKYAAEHYARGEAIEESKVIGFTSFILLIFLLIFSVVFFYFSLHTGLLIKNLTNIEEISVASSLLFILALFTPVTLLQRMLQMIFSIRLQEYIVQRINIIANFIKILSVLWFFRNGYYNIIGYFLFSQIVNFFAALVTLFIARYHFNFNIKAVVVAMRFNKIVFDKTKHLAFISLYLTLTWILYYELDPTVIGKLIGTSQVAIYAIGLTVLTFFRSILGILFSPFNARFNHFIGMGDIEGLKAFYFHIITILAPLIIIPIIAMFLLAKPLVLSWVGINYSDSIPIVKLFILCNIFAFITYPTGMILMAQERIKEMYLVNTIIPIIYWSGIVLSYSTFGLKSFAFFKLIAFGISAVVYLVIMLKYLMNINIKQFIYEIFSPIPITFVIVSSLIINSNLPYEKSHINFLIVSITTGCLIFISYGILYISSTKIRKQISKLFYE